MDEQSLHTDTVHDWITGYLTNSLTPEEMQYLDLLTDVLDELDTPRHTARELNTLRGTWLGNSSVALSIWTGRQTMFIASTKTELINYS